jgi:hypothetical protein
MAQVIDIPKNSLVTIIFSDCGGLFWLSIQVDGQLHCTLDFDTAGERQRACNDLAAALYANNGMDVPVLPQ